MEAPLLLDLQEEDAVSSIMNAHTYATEKNINQLNRQSETRKLSSAPDKVRKRTNPSKSEKLQNALVQDLSASTFEEKAGSKGRKKRRNINIEFIQCSFTDKSKALNSSLDSPGMGTKVAETVKVQETLPLLDSMPVLESHTSISSIAPCKISAFHIFSICLHDISGLSWSYCIILVRLVQILDY